MLRLILAFAAGVSVLIASAFASDVLTYGEAPEWVKPAELPKKPPESKSPFLVLLSDNQTNFTETYSETYIRVAVRLQSPEGLGAGNIQINWDPETTSVAIHDVKIIRDGEVVDLLAEGQRFEQFRREPYLEAAMLNGVLTAALQPAGLRVGDIVEYSYTQKFLNPMFDGTASLIAPGINGFEAGLVNLRYLWPESRDMQWRTTPDLPEPSVRRTRNGRELKLRLKDTKPRQDFPVDAPPRFYMQGVLELSDISDWSRISEIFWPHFDKASSLSADSPLHAIAEKIAAQTDDPVKRAEKALRLVQDDVRYVFLGMDAGAYRPATAEETWARRYGDCKGKTTLLLALLKELGVEAEPVLVSTNFDDGLNQRLPAIALFDHVLVRAEIDGESYWLDGTRNGDRKLAPLARAPYHWGLPLREDGAGLEEHPPEPPAKPLLVATFDIDASKGLDDPAPFEAKIVTEGDDAILMGQQLTMLTDEQAEDVQKAAWDIYLGEADYETLEWRKAEDASRVVMTAKGEVALESTTANGATDYFIPASEIGWDASHMKRDKKEEERREEPWLLPFPVFSETTVTIKLPDGGEGLAPGLANLKSDIDGFELTRTTTIADGKLTLKGLLKIDKPEFDAAAGEKIAELLRKGFEYSATLRTGEENFIPPETLKIKSTGDPEQDASAYVQLSYFLLQQQKYDDAIEAAEKAISLDPDNALGYANRGIAYYWKYDAKKAAADFEKALALDSRNWVALHGQAAQLVNEGQFEEALARADEAIAINPGDTFGMIVRASALFGLERTDEAIEQYREVLRMKPGDIDATIALAQSLYKNGDTDETLEFINKKIKAMPDQPRLLSLRASLYGELGQLDRARDDHDQAVAAEPENAQVLNNRCWFLATHDRDLTQALADCNKALELSPEHPAYLDSRAFVRLRQGKLDLAIEDYDAALEVDPDYPASLYGRGVARLRKGDPNGQEDIDRALEIVPEIAQQFERYGISP